MSCLVQTMCAYYVPFFGPDNVASMSSNMTEVFIAHKVLMDHIIELKHSYEDENGWITITNIWLGRVHRSCFYDISLRSEIGLEAASPSHHIVLYMMSDVHRNLLENLSKFSFQFYMYVYISSGLNLFIIRGTTCGMKHYTRHRTTKP